MRAGGSKRRCFGSRDQEYTLREFMEMLEPSDLQLVQQLIQKYGINDPYLSSRTSKYRLQFRNKLKNPLFTDKIFRAEKGNKVEIALVDASNKVISSGPMATAEIEIVVLDGDFHGGENNEWTEEEFKKNVLGRREGKGSLLKGNLPIKLFDGIGYISDAKFTDNSCWTRSKNFRLGVRLLGGIGMAREVREGISNAFRVKDRHVEKNQKDEPPSMNDAVCRLKGISRDGPFYKKLKEQKINTVRDFLCYCSTKGPETLRAMIEMTEGRWETTYGHASRGRPDIQLDGGLVNLPAPDQNPFEVTGSTSTQISNVLLQPNGVRQLASYVEYDELPISAMSTSALRLAAPISNFESGNCLNKTLYITTAGAWKGPQRLDIPFKDLTEGNGRSFVRNNFDSGSISLCHTLLKILFVARLKVAALRSRESRYSQTSSSRHNWFMLLFVARLKVTALRFRESKNSETSSPNDDYLSFLNNLSPWEDRTSCLTPMMGIEE